MFTLSTSRAILVNKPKVDTAYIAGPIDRESLADPRASLATDLAAWPANPILPAGLIVSGLLYDTETTRLGTVIEPAQLGSA